MTGRFASILLELLCALSFVASGVVVGFCAGGWLGPPLFGRGGHGLEEIGFMFNGAILGAGLGVGLALLAGFRFSRRTRRRYAARAFALGAATALLTAAAVHLFGW